MDFMPLWENRLVNEENEYGTEFKERESIDLKLTSLLFFHFTLNKTLSLIKSHLIKENSFRRSLPI